MKGMKRTILSLVAVAVLLMGATPAFAQGLRAGVSFEYGTASSAFGLNGGSYFSVPTQNNTSADAVISANLEYIFARRWPLEVGLQLKGSFGFSWWNLGTPSGSAATGYPPGVYNGVIYVTPDNVYISADWWAFAPMLTTHVHVGPFVALKGAVGYGPYGYLNVNYWDELGMVAGAVSQDSTSFFPSIAWSLDWSAGLEVNFVSNCSVDVHVGMMGPDFVAGVGLNFSI